MNFGRAKTEKKQSMTPTPIHIVQINLDQKRLKIVKQALAKWMIPSNRSPDV